MKTAEEWIDKIGNESPDDSVRYCNCAEWDVKAIQLEAWKQGMTDAAKIAEYHERQYSEGGELRHACAKIAHNIALNRDYKE